MTKYNLRINQLWNGEDNVWEFRIVVPNNVTVEEVREVLSKTHELLDKEGSEGIYGNDNRSPVALLDYICEKYGWGWEDFNFDMEFSID